MTNGKCKGSFYQERSINIEKFQESPKLKILVHPCCDCCTGCRRVTLWHPRPQGIEATDDFAVKMIARVRWGDGCGGPEVEVDWKHGVILDLSGCYDEVILELVEVLGTAPDEDALFKYGVLSACCGAGAARGCATRTTAQMTGTNIIPVPPFAYAVQFVPTPTTSEAFFAATTDIQQTGSGAGGTTGRLAGALGDDLPDPWMLVNGAESILVFANGDTITYEVVFLIGV